MIDSCGVSKIRSAGEQVIGNVGDLSGTLKRLGGVPGNVGNGAGNLFAKILKGRRMGRGGGKDGASNLSTRGEIKNFNLRAREGRDYVAKYAAKLYVKFQFTRPRGARQYMGLSIYFSAFATIFLRNTKNFYSLYCIFHIFLRNLLNINMCESPGFFCALGVRLRKFALLFYHRLQVR